MTQHKHTPGPWDAARRGAYTDFEGNSRVICGDDHRLAVVQHHGTDEDEANTCLIVAAPDLLAALQSILALRSVDTLFEAAREYPHDPADVADELTAWNKARQAITKATGETP